MHEHFQVGYVDKMNDIAIGSDMRNKGSIVSHILNALDTKIDLPLTGDNDEGKERKHITPVCFSCRHFTKTTIWSAITLRLERPLFPETATYTNFTYPN